jgi:hypothetical protein
VIITPAAGAAKRTGRWPPKDQDVGYIGRSDQTEMFERSQRADWRGAFRGIEFYLPLLHSDAMSLLDYLPRTAIIAFGDGDGIADVGEPSKRSICVARRRQSPCRDYPCLPPVG